MPLVSESYNFTLQVSLVDGGGSFLCTAALSSAPTLSTALVHGHACVCARVQRVCVRVQPVCARACVCGLCAACGYVCGHACSVYVYARVCVWAHVCAHVQPVCVRMQHVYVCAPVQRVCVCTRVQHVYVCVHACSMCVHVCTVRRVCTCVRACARLPCLHGALWAPRGPDCAPPRHRGCRSAPSSAQTRPDRVCPTSSLGHPFAASQWPVWSCSGRHFGKGQLSNSWQGRSRCVRKGEFRGQSWGPGGARAGREGGGGSSATQPQVRVLPVSAGM